MAVHPHHPGVQTPPSVPVSTTPLNNPFGFACLVTLRGGTVSAVAVGGVTLSVFSSLILVPAGSNITLTYAVAPTWTWFGLG